MMLQIVNGIMTYHEKTNASVHEPNIEPVLEPDIGLENSVRRRGSDSFSHLVINGVSHPYLRPSPVFSTLAGVCVPRPRFP